MLNYYKIAGPYIEANDEALFWNDETGWGSVVSASRYDKTIFIKALPLESVGLWEFDADGEPVNFYQVDTLPQWGMGEYTPCL